jgi:hypothetical protein
MVPAKRPAAYGVGTCNAKDEQLIYRYIVPSCCHSVSILDQFAIYFSATSSYSRNLVAGLYFFSFVSQHVYSL